MSDVPDVLACLLPQTRADGVRCTCTQSVEKACPEASTARDLARPPRPGKPSRRWIARTWGAS
jgi:hypothetical protein